MPTVRFSLRLNDPLISGCREGQGSLPIALEPHCRFPQPVKGFWHTDPGNAETDYLSQRDHVLPLLTPQMFSLRIPALITRPTYSLSFSRRNFGGHGIYEKGNPDSPVPDPLWGQNER